MKRRTFSTVTLAGVVAPQLTRAQPSATAGLELRLAEHRGVAEHGWLSSRHTFSFARYHDQRHMGFSDLFVINEDWVKPGRGFGTHPHRDVEIFTYVLDGTLEHKDSMGNGTVIRPGEVQFLSAGRGITHSEFNPSKTEGVHFLQIWLAANEFGAEPSYQQRALNPNHLDGKLALIIANKAMGDVLRVKQDTRVFAGRLNADQQVSYKVPAHRRAYLHVARGALEVNGLKVKAGDGLKVTRGDSVLALSKGRNAEVLLFDLRARGYAEATQG